MHRTAVSGVGVVLGLAGALSPSAAHAVTYSVGPSGTYRQLDELPTLEPGDIVEVEGGATYDAIWFQDDGSPGDPIIVRGLRSSSGARPVIMGGTNTVELMGDHYVLEGFEITGGSSRCVYHHADDIVIRDVVIHDCPRQGLLGAATDSGSLLFEHSEIYRTGGGDRDHQVYMSTDQLAHPGSVFRMQFCYIHDSNGGNGVKSRSERNEIHYNWIENSYYHDLELIGPDPGGTPVAEDAYVENSDVVGNVFIKGGLNPDHYVVRFGGDATGQSNGRYRFVYNTVVLAAGSAGVFRLFDGIESLEAHNNVIYQMGSGDAQIVRDAEAEWVGGTRRVTGSNNWVIMGTGVRDLPSATEWTGTIRGTDPTFESAAGFDYRPASGSPLIDAANPTPMPLPGYAFPMPEGLPLYLPPTRALLAVGMEVARPMSGTGLDIGAFEFGSGPPVMPVDGGMMTCDPTCAGRECGDDGCGGSCGSCTAPLSCSAAGACECGAPRMDCGGACVAPASDPDHCGACDSPCDAAEVCSAGACSSECAGGLTACNRACVDVSTDELHCGACDSPCSGGAMCVGGECMGAPPGRDGGASGADAGTSPEDEGGCGCRVIAGSDRRERAWALALVVAVVAGARRRRR